MSWRLARCLGVLLIQIDASAPNRSKENDGTIGDSAHAATKSDHNPDDRGIVRALDITHDPAHGFNSYQFADFLREHWDDRVQYIISNGRIANIDVGAKAWRAYNGEDPHDHHVHISARGDDRADDARPFSVIPFFDGSAVPPGKDGHALVKFGDHGAAVVELQQLLGGIDTDGYFGTQTDAAVRAYQAAHGLEVDGETGPLTWTALLTNAPVVTPSVVEPPTGVQTSKGSWYSQFDGKFRWRDPGDRPGSAKLGVPDDAQGVAMPALSLLGNWYAVRAPNGKVSIEQVTDLGPAAWTGRIIDISAAAAERFGYSPDNFPTDGIFTFWSIDPPPEVASLSPVQQATRYSDLRNALPPIVIPPPLLPDPEGNTMDDKLKLILITEICKPSPDVKALQLLLLNQPVIPGVPPPVVPPVAPPVVAPSTTGQNLLIGLAGSLIAGMLGMNGNIGMPFGPDMTSTGLFSVLGPLITGLLGLNVPAVNAVTSLVKPKA